MSFLSLSNPKIQRILLIIVIAIIILWILGNASEKFNVFVKKIKPPTGEGIYNPVPESRKGIIEDIAKDIYEYLDQSIAYYAFVGWGPQRFTDPMGLNCACGCGSGTPPCSEQPQVLFPFSGLTSFYG